MCVSFPTSGDEAGILPGESSTMDEMMRRARVQPCVVARGPALPECVHGRARDRYAVLLAVDPHVQGHGNGLDPGPQALYSVATAVEWPGSGRPTAYTRIVAVTDPSGQPAHRTLAIRQWLLRCEELVECEECRDGDHPAECPVNCGPCARAF